MFYMPIEKTYYPNQANYRAVSCKKGGNTFIYFTDRTQVVFQINYHKSTRKFLLHKGQTAPLKYASLLEALKKSYNETLWDTPNPRIII